LILIIFLVDIIWIVYTSYRLELFLLINVIIFQ